MGDAEFNQIVVNAMKRKAHLMYESFMNGDFGMDDLKTVYKFKLLSRKIEGADCDERTSSDHTS